MAEDFQPGPPNEKLLQAWRLCDDKGPLRRLGGIAYRVTASMDIATLHKDVPEECGSKRKKRVDDEEPTWHVDGARMSDLWTRIGHRLPGSTGCVHFLAIQGSIGAGKSTVLARLRHLFANQPEVVFADEPVDLWKKHGCLQAMYRGELDMDFFQLTALATRYAGLEKAFKTPGVRVIVSERDLESDVHVFARNLSGQHRAAYNAMHESFEANYPLFARRGLVYLTAKNETLLQRIKERGREEESGIDAPMLDQLQEGHLKLLANTGADTQLVLHTDDLRPEEVAHRVSVFVRAALQDVREDKAFQKSIHEALDATDSCRR